MSDKDIYVGIPSLFVIGQMELNVAFIQEGEIYKIRIHLANMLVICNKKNILWYKKHLNMFCFVIFLQGTNR